jgi:hypothetical protein
MIHWKIPFKSLVEGTDYCVNIYDSTFTGQPVTLYGAASPFEAQEDDSDDAFAPVRTQSGYLRIVDTGEDASGQAFDWRALTPERALDRPVTLTDGNDNVVWMGFIQPQNYTGQLYGGVQEREFPVMCLFSALQGVTVANTPTSMENFAYIIRELVSAASHPVAISTYYYHGENAVAKLLVDVDRTNFTTSDGDTCSYYSLLEDMCRFWGWTARMIGSEVAFVHGDIEEGDTYLEATPADMTRLASGENAGTERTITSASITGDIFRSTDMDETMLSGYNRAIVHADVRPLDSDLMPCFPEEVEDEMREGGWQSVAYDGDMGYRYTNDQTSFTAPTFEGNVSSAYDASFNIIYTAGNDSTPQSFRDVIRIKSSYIASAAGFARLESLYGHYFSLCRLSLEGVAYHLTKKYENADSKGIGKKTMYVRIGVGADRASALWYNSDTRSWGSTESVVKVALGGTGNTLHILHGSKYLESIWFQGYARGYVFVDILGSDDMPETDGARSFDLSDFSVKILNYERADWPSYEAMGPTEARSERDYTAQNSSRFDAQYDVDAIFASDPYGSFGSGRLPIIAYTILEPEQDLANRIAAYWATSKRRLAIDIVATALPAAAVNSILTIAGSNMHATAIAHNWRDDVVRLTLTE